LKKKCNVICSREAKINFLQIALSEHSVNWHNSERHLIVLLCLGVISYELDNVVKAVWKRCC